MKRKTDANIALSSVKAIVLMSLGGLPAIGSLVTFIVFTALGMHPGPIISLICLIASLFPFLIGWRSMRMVTTLRKLMSSISPGIPSSLARASANTQRSEIDLLWDISALERGGMLKDMTVLEDCLVLELWDSPHPLMIRPDENSAFSQVNKRRPLPLLLTLPVGVCAALTLPFFSHRAGMAVLLGIAAGFVLSKMPLGPVQAMIRHKKARELPAPKVEVPDQPKRDPETEAMLSRGNSYLNELQTLCGAISHQQVGARTQELIDITRQILGVFDSAPEKRRQIRQHIDYYLPTTLKLLRSYEELSRQPVKGANIQSSMQQIEDMMDIIVATFRKDLDLLYQDKNIDVSVDIEVMRQMMRRHDLDMPKSNP